MTPLAPVGSPGAAATSPALHVVGQLVGLGAGAEQDGGVEGAGARGIEDIMMGMAHRGRLNVLANIMGTAPRLARVLDPGDKNFAIVTP